MSILNQIVAKTAIAVDELKTQIDIETLESIAKKQPPARSLVEAIRACPHVPVIAEIKKASPSRGNILPDADILSIARQYQNAGAVAISVLTDKHYFGGSIDDLKTVRQCLDILVLRKDFIIDPIQIIEARAGGADAVLLIAAALDDEKLKFLYETSLGMGMIPLMEIHNAEELERVMPLQPQLIGINNRNLKTMTVDIQTSAKLRQSISQDICVVGESGISSIDHIITLKKAGIDAFLIGTSLMLSSHPEKTLKELNQMKE
ncbi:indole-3-glycerol phosphate synthase [Candidatus Magnetomorum sp. HK-1]|nr:indole-3-glycerol phosphate synthase [Candidatus Magnetomorum sp. HK-1]